MSVLDKSTKRLLNKIRLNNTKSFNEPYRFALLLEKWYRKNLPDFANELIEMRKEVVDVLKKYWSKYSDHMVNDYIFTGEDDKND